jgi:FdhE protein
MVSSENWRIRIARAKLLAVKYPESTNLLEFYVRITELQEDIVANIEPDVAHLQAYYPRLRALAEPLTLSSEDEEEFFRRVLLQPYAEYFQKPADTVGPTCPSCGSKPVAGVMRGEGDGARRALVCSLCALEWPYRRLICPNCGEEDKKKLPVYIAAQIPHVRVEACDTCRCYLKSVDLTKDGFAVPQVDEIATVALNIWADEHDYAKIEMNILGM